jgi:hypothetical protein
MNKRSLGIAAVFLVGCAVGGVSSQLAVPKASAQQAATLQAWEYSCFHQWSGSDAEDITAKANRLGEQRWELTGGGDKVYCFKRPKM